MSDMAARITIWWGGQFTQINRVVSLCFLLFSRPSRQAFRFCIVLLFATLRNSFYIVKYLKNGTKFMLRGGSQALYKTTEFVWLGMHGKVKRSWNGSLALFRGRRGERERERWMAEKQLPQEITNYQVLFWRCQIKKDHTTHTHTKKIFFSSPLQVSAFDSLIPPPLFQEIFFLDFFKKPGAYEWQKRRELSFKKGEGRCIMRVDRLDRGGKENSLSSILTTYNNFCGFLLSKKYKNLLAAPSFWGARSPTMEEKKCSNLFRKLICGDHQLPISC